MAHQSTATSLKPLFWLVDEALVPKQTGTKYLLIHFIDFVLTHGVNYLLCLDFELFLILILRLSRSRLFLALFLALALALLRLFVGSFS